MIHPILIRFTKEGIVLSVWCYGWLNNGEISNNELKLT